MPDDEIIEEPDVPVSADSEDDLNGSSPDESGDDQSPEDEETAGTGTSTVVPEHEGMLEKLMADLGDAVLEAVSNHGDLVVRVANDAWHRAAEVVRDRLDCDYLSFVSGIDWMPRPDPPGWDPDAPSLPVQPKETTFGTAGSEGRFQVFAVVESTASRSVGPLGPGRRTEGDGPKVQVVLKTDVDESAPRVASWTDVYPGADWHERECWEMYGITFDGHPHLRHLYLPGEFEGHPLRKDFPLLAREVKPWPGLVDVELMPGNGDENGEEEAGEAVEAASAGGEPT